jgi:putative ABC transport system permease protein
VLAEASALPGVRAAVGVTPLSIGVTDPDLEFLGGEAISGNGAPGRLGDVLSLGVTAGQLDDLRPGQVAVSAMEASSGAMGVHLGQRVTVYLPDGTPYHATVSAIYQRSLALGDLLIPGSVAAGHAGVPDGYSQVLVAGGTSQELARLAAAHPGITVADRSVYNAQVQQNFQQNDFANNLILGVISVLAAVAMLNTLVIATLERRRQVRLLARVGATGRQLAGIFRWQALFVTVTGIASGAVVCAGTLTALTRSVTGNPVPYIPAVPAGLIIAAVAALAMTAVMASFSAMSGRRAA